MCAQLANKQDWARYHSYEVHQMAELVDSHMRPGPWQKVGYFRKVRPLITTLVGPRRLASRLNTDARDK